MFTGSRRFAAAVVAVIAAGLLAACTSTISATVNADNTVTGQWVLATDRAYYDGLADPDLQDEIDAGIESNVSGFAGSKITSFDDGTWRGSKATFTGIDFFHFEHGVAHAFRRYDSATDRDVLPNVNLSRSGNYYSFDVVSPHRLDFYNSPSPSDSGPNTNLLTLTFPAPILSANVGQVSGNTITFDFVASSITTIHVVAGPPNVSVSGGLGKSGAAKVGKTVKVKLPKINTPGVIKKYQWYASGKAIKKANKSSYKIAKAYKGKTLSVKVTLSAPGYAPVTLSKSFGKVK